MVIFKQLKRVRVIKPRSIALFLTSLMLVGLFAGAGLAQDDTHPDTELSGDFDLTWWTLDGGGGGLESADGKYALEVTIGQPDVSPELRGGDGFKLVGGFWGGALEQVIEHFYQVFLPLVMKSLP
jgi:hypothetical protein